MPRKPPKPRPPAPVPTPVPTPTPPASTLTRALDTDFGNSGVPPQQWFNDARAAGYEGFITTLHTNWPGEPEAPWAPAATALQRALDAGMWIAAYGRPVERWHEALMALDPALRAKLLFYALDVEDFAHPIRREYVDGVRALGVRPIVYTGWGMWGDVMGYDVAGYSDVPEWDYAGDLRDWPTRISEGPIRQFAGWNSPGTMRVGWQVEQRATFNGIGIDRNVFDRAFIGV